MMTTMLRRMFFCVAATVLATLASPGLAASTDKVYKLEVFPTALPAGQTTLVTVKFTNAIPSGNSSFNSIELAAPLGVTIPNQAITTTSGTAVVVNNKIRVSNISPVKPQKSFEFTFNVSVAAGTPCAPGSWDTETTTFVYTGSNFSGETFTLSGVSSVGAAVGCDALLGCAPGSYSENGPDPDVVDKATIERFPNKDASPCQDVAFNITYLDPRKVLVEWDENGQGAQVAVKVAVVWALELTDQLTSFPKRTLVSWESGTEVPAPACKSAAAPQPGSTPMPTFDSNAPHPTLPPPALHPYAGERARACLIEEIFVIQDPTTTPGCALLPAPTPAQGCVRVESLLWITGDPIISRSY